MDFEIVFGIFFGNSTIAVFFQPIIIQLGKKPILCENTLRTFIQLKIITYFVVRYFDGPETA